MVDVKDKGKKSLARLIFGRTLAFLVFLILQAMTLVWLFVWIDDQYSAYGYGALTILSAVLAVRILNEKQNASFKMAWLVPVLLFPVFGALFYMFVQLQMETKRLATWIKDIQSRTKHYLPQNMRVRKELKRGSRSNANLADYLYENVGFPVYDNTNLEYFPLGEDFYQDLLTELKRAKKFIFLEYFIVQQGVMWDGILEILKEKATAGVEIRVLYDGMNVFSNLPIDYDKELREMGIKCRIFNPIRPAISTSQNNRDHRKILVIDNRIAYTGGVNLADEYINRKVRFGHWKDNAIALRGDAVRTFTVMFLQMWNVSAWKLDFNCEYGPYLEADRCLPDESLGRNEQGYVIPFSDSPLDSELVSHHVFLDMIYQAREYVHIMTPYLILDDDILTALTYAAKRGVETVIMVPHIPDKKYAFALAHSYYPELIESGVKIYEYLPGFLHAKTIISDGEKAMVGSVNLDFRSQYLNFECGVYIYRNPVIEDIRADFDATLKKSARMTMESYGALPYAHRLWGRTLRLIAPLM